MLRYFLGLTILLSLTSSTVAQGQCAGDCNGDGRVVVSELILGVKIALDITDISLCPAFDSLLPDERVLVDELYFGINNALSGCIRN